MARHVPILAAALILGGLPGPAAGADRTVRGADELYWTPTLEQAIEMASANKVPIFVMGYSLVGDRSTYTKFGDDCASTVF